jgi:tripartite-type tricarboxylate transporter receptor subunit TctC
MTLWGLVVAFAVVLHGASAEAQGADDYPQRPVTIVVPAAPGGGIDTNVRLVAEGMRRRLGQPFILENRAGGADSVGTTAVARAEPDHYTLLAAPNSPLVFAPLTKRTLAYDPESLVAVVHLGSQPLVLAVRGDFPANSFKDLIDYARPNPGGVQARERRNAAELLPSAAMTACT